LDKAAAFMENIRQAIERARANQAPVSPQIVDTFEPPRQPVHRSATFGSQLEEIEVSNAQLQSHRIVAHDGADQRSRPYDMLRTQVLQSMGLNGWKILGVTSPTSGCGKTLTAINLAFSVARQPNRSVMLADLDLQKPQLADCLGLNPPGGGVLGVLNERAALPNVVMPIRAGNHRMSVLPTAQTRESSELLGSTAMRVLLQDLRRDFPTVILDLPPVLSGDDVIAVLPHVDCILLVAAAGLSKTAEVEEAMRHLQSTQIVRLVLNKTIEASSNYYYY
jgi:protein-tyrosine kinase